MFLMGSLPDIEAQQTSPPASTQTLKETLAQLESQGDYPAMISQLDSWLATHPDDSNAYLRLGEAHHHNGNDRLAAENWKKSIIHHANKLQGYHRVVSRCRQAELYAIGIQFILEGRKLIKGKDTLIWQLAEFYALSEAYDQAIAIYLEYIRESPHYLPVAENYLNRLGRDPSRAQGLLNALQDARKNAATFKETALLIASFSLEIGQPDIGFEALDALSRQSNKHDHIFQFAGRYAENGYAPTAIRAYKLFTERNPDSPYSFVAQLRQAELHLHQSNLVAAIATYNALATRAPDRTEGQEALYRLAEIQLNRLDNLDDARHNLEALLKDYPNSPFAAQARLLLAECALRANDFASVERLLDQVGPGAGGVGQPTRFQMAEMRFFQYDFDQAHALLDSLIKTEPQNPYTNDALELILLLDEHQDQPEALQTLARALLKVRQGRSNQAAEDWSWLEQHAPAQLHQYSLLAHAQLYAQHTPKKALAIYQRLIERYQNGRYVLQAHLGCAVLYETQGDFAAALRFYRNALLRFPTAANAPEIRLHIQRLRQLVPPEGNS